MALITLEVGERFEHYHAEHGATLHVAGALELAIEGRPKVVLAAAGDRVDVPPNTRHTLTNVGNGPATVNCVGR